MLSPSLYPWVAMNETVSPPAPAIACEVKKVERTGAHAAKVHVTGPTRDALLTKSAAEAVLYAVQQAGLRPQGLANMPIPYVVFEEGKAQPVGYAADYPVTLVV